MNFEVGKYFCLATDVSRSKKGIYLIEEVLYDHYTDWPGGGKSPTSCTWIISHNIEDNSRCEFAINSAVYGCCSHIRNYNLDRLLNDI